MMGPAVTDGEIAAINLQSARARAWTRFIEDPTRPGIAEATVECERLAAQFLGDLDALDRLEGIASCVAGLDTPHAVLVQAEIASAVHRFADARRHLERATNLGAPRDAIERQTLAIDQACGVDLEAVLAARRSLVRASDRLEDRVPLGAVLADLGRYAAADAIYRQSLHRHRCLSPFPLAWACFQLGMLWGELVPEPHVRLAAFWYQRAIAYLPCYVTARVHLAEICLGENEILDAEALLRPALTSGDPEVNWRLADVLVAQGRFDEAGEQLDAARSRFESLLERHPLAFADHAAEFFAGSGGDQKRALALARTNFANRPTRRALEQAHAIAASA